MTEPAVLVERTRGGRVAHLVLNRPLVLNAINTTLAEELSSACTNVAADGSVWVAVLRGNGDRAFCAGADLKARQSFSWDQWLEQRAVFRRLFGVVRALPQPLVAAVHGYALGGGCELAMLADIIVAADDAQFGLPETRVGLIPGGGGTQSLPRLIGRARAKELIYTARRLAAQEALAVGLVSRVVPRAELLVAVDQMVDALLSNSPVALREVKRAIDQGADLPFEEGLEREHEAYLRAIASADRQEGIAAFNEKRTPRFTGQ